MSLESYNKKRDFKITQEPIAKVAASKNGAPVFVVHKHNARNLHWDFRLEHEGVLASWAVPKGPPEKFGEKKLAVQVEDHPYLYKDFEGSIPEGEYGAGVVSIWDKGSYEPIKWDKDVVEFILNGTKMLGRYSLIKTKGYHRNSWLLIKQKPKVV